MAEKEEMISQFKDVTGVSTERAEFFLESANWTLQLALSSFFEGENDQIAANIEPELSAEPMDEDDIETKPVSSASAGAIKKNKPKSKPRFATLASLNNGSSSEEEEEKGQAFYAGGSEHSGNIILGPPKKKPVQNYANELFRAAQAGNMEQYDPNSSSSSENSEPNFGGTGYRLGQTDTDHVAVGSSKPAAKKKSECETVTVKVWRQGFSVDDGELRPYDEPQNRQFFECITRNEIPVELRKPGNTMIHVNVEDHLSEDFVKRAPVFKTFAGSGHTLGNPSPNTVDEAVASATSSSSDTSQVEAAATSELAVDPALPTTMIQIRLADGSRLSARFNHSHNISDIRRYIQTARPQYASQSFVLLTSFPSKPLLDENQTIEEAKLQNAALLQRLK